MSKKKITSIGGQAVIEGVMMRGPHKIAIAVRKPDGEIIVDESDVKAKGAWLKVPIIRGVVSFFSSMVIGVKALTFSAKFFDTEEDEKKSSDVVKENDVSNKEKEKKNKNGENDMPEWAIYVSVLVSLLISVGLFMVLPNVIANFAVPDKESNVIMYNVVESMIKIAIFLGYLVAVSQMNDIKRVFEYHGAEHKSIFCYENGEELTVENVKKYSRFHPRCGTSFLLFVIII